MIRGLFRFLLNVLRMFVRALDLVVRGVFYARGPSFEAGRAVAAFESVDLYNVFAAVLGIGPAPNDGDAARVEALLR